MEAVAERAAVSRPLVYKHFANRNTLLAAAYRREASKLHAELASEVSSAGTVEEMYQALLRGSIRATEERGETFSALRSAGGWNEGIRREQRSRDRRRPAPSPPWRLNSTGLSAVALSLSPPCCWVRSMPSWCSGVAIRACGAQKPSRRHIWRWSSAPIRWRPLTQGPRPPRANYLDPPRVTTDRDAVTPSFPCRWLNLSMTERSMTEPTGSATFGL